MALNEKMPLVRSRRLLVAALLCCAGLPLWLQATTVPGGTRNVNVADGIVTTGAVGTNGGAWESDEVLSAADGVQWFMTWDAANLYIGRVGGNNATPSVAYVHAEYPGAAFATTGYPYNQLLPGLTAMGGTNFVASISIPVTESRDYTGVWSGGSSLSPQFSTQVDGDHMEVAIPWSAISAGNGRPSSLRIVFYQVASGAPGCAQELVFGVSPWGDGTTGNGPSVAVNDGQATSAPQPNGCDAGDLSATRWWGCYPTDGPIGPKTWVQPVPVAGPDDSICVSASSYFLSANAAPWDGAGTWSVLSQPSGSPTVAFNDVHAPNAFAQNLLGVGTYVFLWNFDFGGCPVAGDTLRLQRVPQAATAAVMGDTVLGCSASSVILRGNGPGNGIGTWSVVSGGGVLATPNDSICTVTGLPAGNSTFSYLISNGVCPGSLANVDVYVPIPVAADAGADQSLCQASATAMSATDPDSTQASAVGVWALLDGPSTCYFGDYFGPSSGVTFLVPGTYTITWTVTNHSCPASVDTIYIVNYTRPISDAGGDLAVCLGDLAIMAANDPMTLDSNATSWWVQNSGPSIANILSPNAYDSPIMDLQAGTYGFTWWMSNGTCPPDSDAVAVTVVDLQAGSVQSAVLADSGFANGSITLAAPTGGFPSYSYSLNGINFSPFATFGGLAAGEYMLFFMDGTGCMDSIPYTLGYTSPSDTGSVLDSVKVPTGFSPNGDGNNDTWELPGIDKFPNAEIEVFNSWGGVVFQASGAYTPWNGQRNAQDLPSAVYYFVIDLHREGYKPLKGTLTILR